MRHLRLVCLMLMLCSSPLVLQGCAFFAGAAAGAAGAEAMEEDDED